MISATSRQPMATSLPSEDQPATCSLDAPPDRNSKGSYSLSTPISMQPHRVSISTSKTVSHLEASTSPTVAYSPYMADSTGGSASDYEHELDSPSSLSSWNSWAGGSRRGDLADVEDLELDGITGGEPELETVSELDEESSGFYSGSDRAGLDSDDEIRHQKVGAISFGLDGNMPRRKNVRIGGQFNEISHNHHVHHASNQHHYHHPTTHHSPAPPCFPHFSPRAGGHGLSHASRHTLRAPPNLAARRRKGRIAELAEEGGGEAINTTIMPSKASANRREKEFSTAEEERSNEQDDPAPSQTETEADHGESNEDAFSPSTPTLHSSSHAWNEFEFIGPPPLPTRCVSPSETVPVVPSPLCVCLNAEEQAGVEEKSTTPSEINTTDIGIEESVTTPSSTRSGSSYPGFTADASTPSRSPPQSPQLVRKSSRGRRLSSPGRSKPRIPLRPCFRRRASAQVSKSQSEYLSETESNGESSSHRGRVKVRFSEAPPTEVRTHSPVEYDRKACFVSNRLSSSDVEELREMKMGLGLLEAKWAAMAACKTESAGEEDSETEYASTPKFLLPPTTLPSGERKRPESISSSAPTRFCKDKIIARDHQISPADHLRIEREKERERACQLAGIGTGIGFRYSGGGGPSTRQLHHGGSKTPGACNSMSLISRFGLSKPPPPLPGLGYPKSPYEGGTSLHRPSSAPPIQSTPMMAAEHSPELDQKLKDTTAELDDGEDSRGRSFDKIYIRTLTSSTSTDRTETESSPSTPASIPELKHTSPSPSPSPGSSPERTRTLPSASPLPSQPHLESAPKLIRPHIQPFQPPVSPTNSFTFSSSACGYDSPASEFYESGSEYDLIG